MTTSPELTGWLLLGLIAVLFLLPLVFYQCSRMATLGKLHAIKTFRQRFAHNPERTEQDEP